MDYMILSHILYELTLSVSGEQKLDRLVKKAASAFLKKLNCTHVSILQYKNNCLETTCVIPRVALKNPAYYELIDEFEKKLLQDGDKNFIILKKDLYYYGFPLRNFGLLLLGRKVPIEEMFLKELLPITNILAQNCFFNLDAAIKRQAIEAELKKERHLLRVIIDTIPDLIFYKDTNGVYKAANKATGKFFSLLPSEITGRTDWDIHYQAASKYREIDRKVMQSGRVQRYEAWFKRHDGRLVPFETMKAPIYDAEGRCIGTVAVSRDITERKHYEEQLKYLSVHDQLTGLYNRRFLEEEIERLDTPRQLPISIIMGDLNGLKLANDVFGHQEGDRLLIKATEIINGCCRQEDLIARWGGDEIVILLPQTGIKTAEEISRRIKEKCDYESRENGPVQISIALGYATKSKATENIWQVLKEAEDSMYSDKLLHAKSNRDAIISSLKAALFEKSMETEEHAQRLKELCRKIGKSMGLNPHQMDELELLATLHDIGKVAIKKSILMKPGPLTEGEWVQMKKHPEIGYRIAQAAPELSSIAEYILSHHERWDGKGYPRGLKEEEIPLLSRILAVADAFDAMTNNRTYRKAIGREEALAAIKRNAGKQFDPKVVSVFCQLNITELPSCYWT
jgi:diguanylate cyclase (GGDEF)-like protein/PAS domain S-box-containing protein